jgi:hypothetical protein
MELILTVQMYMLATMIEHKMPRWIILQKAVIPMMLPHLKDFLQQRQPQPQPPQEKA